MDGHICTDKSSSIKNSIKQTHLRTFTNRAINLSRFGQSVCELQTVVLRTNNSTAHNISYCCTTPDFT